MEHDSKITKRVGGSPKTFDVMYEGYSKMPYANHRSVAKLDGKEIGDFNISKGPNNTWNMTIYVEEEHRGKNLAAELVKILCDNVLEKDKTTDILFDRNQKIYIDTNANSDFWVGKLKMRENETYDSKNIEGAGYELVMTFGELYEWSHSKTTTLFLKK